MKGKIFMKLLLTSGGISNKSIENELKRLINKKDFNNVKMLYCITASNYDGGNMSDWLIDDLIYFKNAGFEIDICDINGINKEKFIESFVRRFANSAQLNRKYRIIIHDIDECPPKVSVTLIATQEFSFVSFFEGIGNSDTKFETEADIVNTLTAILESKTPNDYDA